VIFGEGVSAPIYLLTVHSYSEQESSQMLL